MGSKKEGPIYVDPNKIFTDIDGDTKGIVPLEDLNIIVDLSTVRKPRSLLTNNGTTIDGQTTGNGDSCKNGVIKILGGSAYGGDGCSDDQNKMLTTSYTELSTVFNKSGDNVEGLGLTDINIEFNSSYAPLITINMVDVRGSSLFAAGNNSDYNVFFELPYPIFRLKIQGYYGKSVTYCLHLTKFVSKFNAETGNFDIKCDFIGYTYAFLTDMLMGYIRANTYTEIGKQEFNKVIEEYAKIQSLNDANGEQFVLKTKDGKPLTLQNYFDVVKVLDEEFEKVKQDNETAKKLDATENKRRELSEIRKSIINHNSVMVNNKADGRENNIKNTAGGIILYDKQLNDTNSALHTTYVDERLIKGLIANYNINLAPEFKLEEVNVKKWMSFLSENNSSSADAHTKEVHNNIIAASKKVKPHKIPEFYPYSLLMDRIKNVGNSLDSTIKNLQVEVGKLMREKAREALGFAPTIEVIVGILSAHVDAFYNTIRRVSENAERSEINGDQLYGNEGDNMISQKDVNNIIYPWPKYLKDGDDNGDDRKYEAWLGNRLPETHEARYIEDLLDGLIAVQKSDNASLDEYSGEMGWYSINPLEINNATINPYKSDYVKNGSTESPVKILLDRAFIFFNHTVKHMSQNELIVTAKLEANNFYLGVKSVKNTKVLNQIRDSKFLDYNSIISRYSSINGLLENDNPYLKHVVTSDPQFTNYTYIFNPDGVIPLTNNLYSDTISINDGVISLGKEIQEVNDDGDIIVGPTHVRNSVESTTYVEFLDFLPAKLMPSYGSDILKDGKLDEDINIAKKQLNENQIDEYTGSEIRTTPGWDLYDSTLGCQVFQIFKEFNAGGDETYIPAFFYRGELIKTVPINGRKYPFIPNKGDFTKQITDKYWHRRPLLRGMYYETNNRAIMADSSLAVPTIKGSNFYTPGFYFSVDRPYFQHLGREKLVSRLKGMVFSLFGSEFYYAQTNNHSRALLFLHTFDLIQSYDDSDDVKDDRETPGILSSQIIQGILAERAGVVTLPRVWVLFLGGLLWRIKQASDPILFNNGSNHYYIPFMNSTTKPHHNEYLCQLGTRYMRYVNESGIRGSLSFSAPDVYDDDDTRLEIESIIFNLPLEVKESFIREFEGWVVADWEQDLQPKLEIFSGTVTEYVAVYNSYTAITTPAEYTTYLNNFNLEYYDQFGITDMESWTTSLAPGSKATFDLGLSKKEDLQSELYKLITTTRIMVNGSWRLWNNYADEKDILGVGYEKPMRIFDADLETYLNAVETEYKRLLTIDTENGRNDDTEVKEQIFQSLDNDYIKLSLYRSIKSIYEKWIAGNFDNDSCALGGKNLIETFKFLDRDFSDIGDKFMINPGIIKAEIMGDMNQSFYDVVSRLLSDNYFNFIPLPTYIDYQNEQELTNAFRPYTFTDDSLSVNGVSGPSFVCVYSGQKSIHLDLGNKDSYPDDGQNLNSDTTDFGSVPVFAVNYGQENQNYFKNITLDQEEYSETQEALKITEDLANRGSEGNPAKMGQNLFNIYNTRSYSCDVEMLGDAMIQPMMYFQLNNIPMFRGAYLIINTSHNITANHMSTKFKGVRISSTKTPLIDESNLYMSIYSSLKGGGDYSDVEVDVVDGSSGSNNPTVTTNPKDKSFITPNIPSNSPATMTTEFKTAYDTNQDVGNLLEWGDPMRKIVVTSSLKYRTRSDGSARLHKGYDLGDLGEPGITKSQGNTPIYAVADGEIVFIRVQLNRSSKVSSGAGLYMQLKHVQIITLQDGTDKKMTHFTNYMHLSRVNDNILPTWNKHNKSMLSAAEIVTSKANGALLIPHGGATNAKLKELGYKHKVKKGDLIGYMGGLPSDKNSLYIGDGWGSSGWINTVGTRASTGYHLHFEVWEDVWDGTNKLRNPGFYLPSLINNPDYGGQQTVNS